MYTCPTEPSHVFADSGYFSEGSYDHLIPTAWIPFLDANEENGCMQVCLLSGNQCNMFSFSFSEHVLYVMYYKSYVSFCRILVQKLHQVIKVLLYFS